MSKINEIKAELKENHKTWLITGVAGFIELIYCTPAYINKDLNSGDYCIWYPGIIA